MQKGTYARADRSLRAGFLFIVFLFFLNWSGRLIVLNAAQELVLAKTALGFRGIERLAIERVGPLWVRKEVSWWLEERQGIRRLSGKVEVCAYLTYAGAQENGTTFWRTVEVF